MSGCSCIAVYVDEGYSDFGQQVRVAGRERTCIECQRTIELGEQYEYSWGALREYDDEEISQFDEFATCIDCHSMRTAFFCEGWWYGRCWDDLGDHLADVCADGSGVSSECLGVLTDRARNDVFEMIEEVWSEIKEEE